MAARKIVFFSPYVLWKPHFETDLEIAEGHLARGDEVTFLVCDGQLPACEPNQSHCRWLCSNCRSARQTGLELLSRPVRTESFYRLTGEDQQQLKSLPLKFDSVEELVQLRDGPFDLGMAALSTLISLKRDADIDLRRHADLASRVVRAGWIAHRSMLRYLAENQVDRVYVFNGRFALARAILRACQERGVECLTHDIGHDIDHYAVYPNTMPHDRAWTETQIRQAWANAAPSERIAVARHWYEQRATRPPKSAISFTRSQQAGMLPEDWDPTAHNVAVFISSEDEFAAIGSQWRNPIYEDQLAGLRAIKKSLAGLPASPTVYVRVHPNLAKVRNAQTRAVLELAGRGFRIIEPRSPVSTYALLQHADTVLSFGSTAGIEAVYWGRPSILAGMSYYRNLGATYNPATHLELMDLVCRRLAAKPIEPALMYGHYFGSFGRPFQHYEADRRHDGRFKGRVVKPTPAVGAANWLFRRPATLRRHLARVGQSIADLFPAGARRAG